MNIIGKLLGAVLFSILFGATASASGAGNFSVNFTNCVESIVVGLGPTANARQYVPSDFILVGEGQPVTPLVVRTAKCITAID